MDRCLLQYLWQNFIFLQTLSNTKFYNFIKDFSKLIRTIYGQPHMNISKMKINNSKVTAICFLKWINTQFGHYILNNKKKKKKRVMILNHKAQNICDQKKEGLHPPPSTTTMLLQNFNVKISSKVLSFNFLKSMNEKWIILKPTIEPLELHWMNKKLW